MSRHSLTFTCVLGTLALVASCADPRGTSTSSDELAARIPIEPAPEPVPVTDGGMPMPDAPPPPPSDGGVSWPDGGGDDPPPDGPPGDGPDEPPTPECFGDLLVVADYFDQQVRQDILPDCNAPDVAVPTTTTTAVPVSADPPGDDDDGGEEVGPDPIETDDYLYADPTNCGYSEDQIERHFDAVLALTHFQETLRIWLEQQGTIYTSEGPFDAAALLACLTLIEQPVADPPPQPQPPPPPVCTPPNTEYNCKALVWGKTDSYYSSNSKWVKEWDPTRGTTCTDDLWNGFWSEKIMVPPWDTRGWAGQIVARGFAAYSGNIWGWQHRKSCHRETPTIQNKYRLMLEPRALLVPRWIWDHRNQRWVENNHNFGFFYNAQNQKCPADCLMANEGARKFRIGASVRPKLTALFAGIVKSMLVPDGFRDFGNMETNYLSQVTGTLHCFGPGTLYTAQDTFTTLPSDVPMPFNATIAPDCNVTDNVGVNGSITYTQQGQQPQLSLGLGANASQQTSCKRDAGSEIRMSLACNMAEGAGFANFRTADIDMPAYGNACVTNGRCSWLSMSIGGAAANKLDLGYWFEQLVSIARASPGDGNGWAHRRKSSALFARGKWDYDPQNPDWAGRWANHRHAWEGNACRVYKVTNETTGAAEPMGEDKAICHFYGQNVTDPSGAPGVPSAVQPNVMMWPYSNTDADWDPDVPRPSGVECTQGSHCSSGVCNAGVCQ